MCEWSAMFACLRKCFRPIVLSRVCVGEKAENRDVVTLGCTCDTERVITRRTSGGEGAVIPAVLDHKESHDISDALISSAV